MSFLAPLYFLGALAVAGPVLLHLIRRRPRGSVPFSSAMFLKPSPPRITQKRRLENWPLLLLRCLGLLMIAAAFSRPYWSRGDDSLLTTAGRRTVILIDRSASMRREDLWDRAVTMAEKMVEEQTVDDWCGIMTFDSGVQTLSDRDNTGRTELFAIVASLRRSEPTWRGTDLGGAIAAAADWVQQTVDREGGDRSAAAGLGPATIVLISDLQNGAETEALRGYPWPADVTLDVRLIAAKGSTNAAVSLMRSANEQDMLNTDDEAGGQADVPARVVNSGDANASNFRLAWTETDTDLSSTTDAASINVPPGAVRTVRVPLPAELDADKPLRLVLRGDDQPFDNIRYIVPPSQMALRLLFHGPTNADPASSLWYYLSRLPLDSATRSVSIEAIDSVTQLGPADVATVPLVIVAAGWDQNEIDLKSYVNAGGRVLFVLGDARSAAGVVNLVGELTGDDQFTVSEADVADYAMLSRIDFSHPLFAAMVDPQYNDFTKIRFWKHREIQNLAADWQVMAGFDSGTAAIVKRDVGGGDVWMVAAGWQPDQSQWALSTKFLPMMSRWFGGNIKQSGVQPEIIVGEPLPWSTTTSSPDHREGGRIEPLGGGNMAAETPAGETVTRPGVYRYIQPGQSAVTFAANLDAAESDTAPMNVELLEQLGVTLGRAEPIEQVQQSRRQRRDQELEAGQRLWRWVLLGAITTLILETVLGGRHAKRIA